MFEKILKSLSDRAEEYLSNNTSIGVVVVVIVILLQVFGIDDNKLHKQIKKETDKVK